MFQDDTNERIALVLMLGCILAGWTVMIWVVEAG